VAAAKYSSDFFFKNSFYAKVGGITTAELNELELEFLFRTHFDLFVKEDTYSQYQAHLLVYSNSTQKLPRQLQLPMASAKESKSKTIIRKKSVSRPQSCKLQQFASRGTDRMECECFSTVRTPQTATMSFHHSRCRQYLNSRYHHSSTKIIQNQTNNLQRHRRHIDPVHFSPYPKRHRGDKITVKMDIWFPSASSISTVAAR